MVKDLPSNAGDSGLIPGWGTKIPHAVGKLSLCATTRKGYVLQQRPRTHTSPTRQLRVGLLPHFGKLWPRCHHWAQRKAPIAGCLLPGSPGTGVQQSQQGRLEGPGFQAPPRVSAHALAQEAAAPPTPGLSLFRDSICPGNESNIIH